MTQLHEPLFERDADFLSPEDIEILLAAGAGQEAISVFDRDGTAFLRTADYLVAGMINLSPEDTAEGLVKLLHGGAAFGDDPTEAMPWLAFSIALQQAGYRVLNSRAPAYEGDRPVMPTLYFAISPEEPLAQRYIGDDEGETVFDDQELLTEIRLRNTMVSLVYDAARGEVDTNKLWTGLENLPPAANEKLLDQGLVQAAWMTSLINRVWTLKNTESRDKLKELAGDINLYQEMSQLGNRPWGFEQVVGILKGSLQKLIDSHPEIAPIDRRAQEHAS